MEAKEHERDVREDGTAVTSELGIMFHDEDIVVLNKPQGLRTVPGKASGPEAETRAHVRSAAVDGEVVYTAEIWVWLLMRFQAYQYNRVGYSGHGKVMRAA